MKETLWMKIKRSSHKKIWLAGLLVVVFLLLGVEEYLASYSDSGMMQPIVGDNVSNLGVINNDTVIEQTFVTDQDFCGVALMVGTYRKRIQVGEIHVTVTDTATGNVVVDDTRRMESMRDNTYVCFTGDKQIKPEKKTEYRIVITGNHIMKRCGVTVWTTQDDGYADGTLVCNNEQLGADVCFSLVQEFQGGISYRVFAKRLMILAILFVFFLLHIFLDVRKLYETIYKYRWPIAFALFVFCVLNKFNGSSLAEYDWYVQQGAGSEYIRPLFGEARMGRSDEWMVSIPRIMSAEYTDYGKYNDIVMGVRHTNMSASGLYRSYSLLAKPSDWGYYLFGTEYGLSYVWCFHIIFGFMFSYELCHILTKKNKWLSLLGAGLIWFSMFNMGWSIAIWLFAGQAALVLFYYFLSEPKLWKKALLGFGTAVFGAEFVVNLYPAWQVPAGYVYLGLLIWMFVSRKEYWKAYKKREWAIGFAAVAFMISIIGAFLYNDMDYIREISSTVYPAGRVDYGGFQLNKLLGYLSSTLSPFINYENPSEMGCFFNFFPVSMILFLYVLIKKKGKSLLMWCLAVPSLFLTLYCTMELPHKLVEVTLMSKATSVRTADVVGYANVLMLIIALSEYETLKQMKWYVALPVMGCTVGLAVWNSQQMDMQNVRMDTLLLAVFAVAAGTGLIAELRSHIKRLAMVALSVVMIYTGMSFNPVQVGIDPITTKPVAYAIRDIVEKDPDALWIGANNFVLGDYLVALGARTINSTNYVPNLKLWKILDPEEKKEEVYNRYAHLRIDMTDEDTEFSLAWEDQINLQLNYAKLQDLGIKYLFSVKKLETDQVNLKQIYGENRAYIYEVQQ
ncbi:MAG: hypothetical protein SO172_02455 [Pararoseburia sp.]|nr:hypothetical protein [Pararoseburia sp.]